MHGFLIVILGSLCLAFQNVLLRVIFSESLIAGQFVWGGLLAPTPDHSLLILQIRSVLVLPAMALLAWRLYPTTGEALQKLFQSQQRPLLMRTIISSSFLFLALALLFLAIATIPAGVATVLFFIHPAITGLLAWKFFGNRPTRLRGIVTGGVLLGSVLVTPGFSGENGNVLLGVGAALGASVAYSIQGLLAQSCFGSIHPIPFTLINFIVMALLSTLLLPLLTIDVPAGAWEPLWIISILASVLTLLGQLLYNIGIHLVSAASMAIVAVSNPVFTVVLAWVGLQEDLQWRQVLGVLLVIVSIVALGYDRSPTQPSESPYSVETE
ncbi:DMT family transporter [Thermocoleostomius sinensis]|uniref:DMT family transporter n=1 Tax=Thermocoleostomius sinensis A174 TaxID=2016057 RepID=A0A9E8ZFN8_9CYAN|nr:DMT family transporter [Thermocoleostomius sinensis]WAL60927.1 DMT family transporter [Thermocoleostomius sinensis A174]